MKTFTTLLFCILLIPQASLSQCDPMADYTKLVALYNATNGSNWTYESTSYFSISNNSTTIIPNAGQAWDFTQPMDTWHGVELNSQGCVEKLILSYNNLQGDLPNLDLESLNELYCGGNNLTGDLHDFDLPNLTVLICDDNQLSGSIPDFSSMPNLELLWCFGNQLSGSIPDFSNIPFLYDFWCSENNLTGTIPDFSNLPNLRDLYIHNNGITGEIPDFSNLPSLRDFPCFNNELTGSIPDFSNTPELRYFFCERNNLTGSIPDFSNTQMIDFYCNNNELTGSIPNFSNTPFLREFYCSNNLLTGSFPDFSNTPLLSWFGCDNNQITGVIPNLNLPNLVEFACNNNLLTDNLSNFNNLNNLEYLYLSNNLFTFDDIVLMPSSVVNLAYYSPQATIFEETTLTAVEGETFAIDLGIDEGIGSNVYTWSKDGTFFQTVMGSNELSFPSITLSDEGVYTVEVTNANAPDLTLTSYPITILVEASTTTNEVIPNTFSVAPNPSLGDVFVSIDTPNNVQQLYIYDAAGKLHKSIKLESLPLNQPLSVNLPKGIYFFSMFDSSGIMIGIKKVVVLDNL